MAEALIDGTGSGFLAKVDSTNRLFVRTEGISIGSVSVSAGSVSYIPAGSVIITNTVAGSVVSLPGVDINNPVTIGSYTTQQIVGSVAISSPISVSVGSESWVQNFNDLGSQRTISAGSVIVTNKVAGSVVSLPGVDINSPAAIGSYTTQGITGNVDVDNFGDLGSSRVVTNFGALGSSRVVENFGDLGSSRVITNFGVLGSDRTGSFAITTNPVPVSGISKIYGVSGGDWYPLAVQSGTEGILRTTASVVTGSEVYIMAGSVQTYDPIGVGSTLVTNFGALGSDRVITNFDDLGSSVVVENLYAGSKSYQGDIYGVSGVVEVSNTVTGSIVSMPAVSVTTGSEQWIQNYGDLGSSRVITNFGDLGSSVVVENLYAGSEVYQGDIFGISGIVEVSNVVNGSIISMPDVTITDPVTIGSYTTQQIVGSVAISSPISVTTGSESWIQNPVGISGTNVIGSVVIMSAPVLGVSGTIFTGGDLTGSVSLQGIGSVHVANPSSVTAGSESWIKGGSIVNYDVAPNDVLKNNPYYSFEYIISGTAAGVTGSTIGSIIQFIGAGSYVQVLTYSTDLITNVGSWS